MPRVSKIRHLAKISQKFKNIFFISHPIPSPESDCKPRVPFIQQTSQNTPFKKEPNSATPPLLHGALPAPLVRRAPPVRGGAQAAAGPVRGVAIQVVLLRRWRHLLHQIRLLSLPRQFSSVHLLSAPGGAQCSPGRSPSKRKIPWSVNVSGQNMRLKPRELQPLAAALAAARAGAAPGPGAASASLPVPMDLGSTSGPRASSGAPRSSDAEALDDAHAALGAHVLAAPGRAL